MDKNYNHALVESEIYKKWESSGAFNPDTQKNADKNKKPYSVLLPPPNANASLHAGHTMFVIEDILIRYHRMLGMPTLWLPGTDHAGFETQYVYEKFLSKHGKSRFDFDRDTLYKDIHSFVTNNSGLIEKQLKQLGFSLDWSRKTFMLDERVINIVYDTFIKMVHDGYVYRDNYIVNYSPKSGTTFSELEVLYVERNDPLYFIKYGPVVIATVRPETKFRDVALAANPDDPRYKHLIGTTITFNGLLGPVEMKVLADPDVDPAYGTGIMKVTPAHDAHDFQLGRKYNLPITPIIDFNGRMDFSWFIQQKDTDKIEKKYLERAKKYHGKKVAEARKLIVEDMKLEGMIEKIQEDYLHNVAVDYKTNGDIEPMVMPNWFVATKKLAEPAIAAAKTKNVTFVPARFETMYYQWLENIRDWPISRQIVWGIRIPVWYDVEKNPDISVTFLSKDKTRITGTIGELLKSSYTLREIRDGLQTLRAPTTAQYIVSVDAPSESFLPETDTFDTWFSSGQWPLTTLGYPNSPDFKTFYPTQVLDTMWDILFFWVARMIMFGLYQTGKVPFNTVYLHSMVTDEKGAKMSKSKGNVIDPITLVEKYGADALRFALIAGCAPGNPIALSENKVRGYRNFTNKLWNMTRLLVMQESSASLTNAPLYSRVYHRTLKNPEHKRVITELTLLTNQVTDNLNRYRFSDAAVALYDFAWKRIADEYLETIKEPLRNGDEETFVVARHALGTILTLLHPFMPFITEELWNKLYPNGELLITSPWPKMDDKK